MRRFQALAGLAGIAGAVLASHGVAEPMPSGPGQIAPGLQRLTPDVERLTPGVERLTMPFTCVLAQGRLTLTPSAERPYPIAGRREQRLVRLCAASSGAGSGARAVADCPTVVVHRFDVACEGGPVALARLAAAAPSGASGRVRDRLTGVPAGYAALREIGARLALGPGSAAETVTAATRAPSTSALETSALETSVSEANSPPGVPQAKVERDVPDAALPQSANAGSARNAEAIARREPGRGPALKPASSTAAPSETASAPAQPVDATGHSALQPAGSDAAVLALPLKDGQTADARAFAVLACLLAAMLGSLGTAAWLVLTGPAQGAQKSPKPPPLPAGLMRAFLPGSGLSAEMAANSQASITALIAQAQTLVAELASAPPLREVLESELDIIRNRLGSVAGIDATDDGRRIASTYRVLVRDCERIRRIADSALASFNGPRGRIDLPQTRGEAYSVLGVNPDVADAVLKRLVDALRMSWHPDLARDEADRHVREARVTQINVAWDLISGKREAA